MNNAKLLPVKTTQTAIPELGRDEKTLYFLKITIGHSETTLNVGEKTYNTIKTALDLDAKGETKLNNLGGIKQPKP